ITIELRDAELRDVIWLFAKEANLNILLGEEVKGRVTVSLSRVPMKKAFEAIISSAGVGYIVEDGMIKIHTVEEIRKTREIEPLQTEIIKVRYAPSWEKGGDLEELKKALEKHLSGRAGSQIIALTRTNSLIITDTRSNIEKIKKLIMELDVKGKQVLIEAKIVEASLDFSRSIGIEWGGSFTRTSHGGTWDWRGGIAGGQALPSSRAGELVSGTGGLGNTIVNLPITLFNQTPFGGINLNFARITGESFATFNARLTLAESEGKAKVLSSPKILTLNNKEARISQGARIPYVTVPAGQQVQFFTQTVEFVEAALTLQVIPHIVDDEKLILKIKATKNTPDFSRSVLGNPTILTEEAQAEVSLNDGETVVIGGIYQLTEGEQEKGIPYLKNIPYLGGLFKTRLKTEERSELLFFITPRIVIDDKRQ
ncbi:MAG: type IV pilus secretin PilQ, partial [Candidatus Aenigmatarchaeota archaeon]